MRNHNLLIGLGVVLWLAAPVLAQNIRGNASTYSAGVNVSRAPTLAALQHLVEQRRWDEARNLMQQILANQRQPAPQMDTATQLSSDVTSTLLDRPHDEVYKMYETDVKIDMSARRLSQQYNTEQDLGKKEELLGQLQLIVKDQFQVRQKIRELELQQLKQRLAEVQAQLARRQELADAIIERRVNQLTGQADELDWDHGMITSPPQPPGRYSVSAEYPDYGEAMDAPSTGSPRRNRSSNAYGPRLVPQRGFQPPVSSEAAPVQPRAPMAPGMRGAPVMRNTVMPSTSVAPSAVAPSTTRVPSTTGAPGTSSATNGFPLNPDRMIEPPKPNAGSLRRP